MPASLAAYEAAIEVGVDMVRWTRDGARTASRSPSRPRRGGPCPVAELSAAESVREPHTAGSGRVELARTRSCLSCSTQGRRRSEAVELCAARRLSGARRPRPGRRLVAAIIRRDVPDVEVGLSLEAPGGPELLRRADACGARFLSLDMQARPRLPPRPPPGTRASCGRSTTSRRAAAARRPARARPDTNRPAGRSRCAVRCASPADGGARRDFRRGRRRPARSSGGLRVGVHRRDGMRIFRPYLLNEAQVEGQEHRYCRRVICLPTRDPT